MFLGLVGRTELKIESLTQAVNRLSKNNGWPRERAILFVSEVALLGQDSTKYVVCDCGSVVLEHKGQELKCCNCKAIIDRGTRTKLTEEQINEIRNGFVNGVKPARLAEEYGVNASTISHHLKDLTDENTRSAGQKDNRNARKLTEAQERAIYRINKEEGVSQTKLAKKYEVNRKTIAAVIKRIDNYGEPT
jgi:DNA-binding MarR family transcriptional regulator